MFGAFRPSAPLSGGLLWKIAWKMTSSQKLRQRRRLRRVDNIVATLDNALKRQAGTSTSLSSSSSPTSESATTSSSSTTTTTSTLRTPEETASRRHGRGPHKGEWVPSYSSTGVLVPGGELLGDAARRTGTIKLLERWKAEMPTEKEMLPRDKYTMFDRKAKHYRKGLHKLPKWTRVSQRVNPPGF